MATVRDFEDLACWKKARELENYVYKLTQNCTFKTDFGLKDQINRSTGSAMDNIAEGFGRGSNRELINFLIIANGSATEAKSQLCRALDRKHISQEEFDTAYKLASDTIGAITNFITYLRKSISRTIRTQT